MTALPNRHSKIEGNAWEEIFARMAKYSGFALIRIPDGCRRIPGPGGRPRLLPVKTPFDFVLAHNGWVGFFDTKTINEKTFQFSQITEHQLMSLLDMEANNCVAGYIVFFRRYNRIIFFSARKLSEVRRRESLLPEDGIDLGTVYDMKLERLRENTERETREQSEKEDREKISLRQENWPGEDGNENPQG